MVLTAEIFFHKFRQRRSIYTLNDPINHRIEAPLIYNGQAVERDFLYILYADDLHKALNQDENCTFLCIGIPDCSKAPSCTVMYVPSGSNELEIYNLAVMIFYEFNKFSRKVLDYDNCYTLPQVLVQIKEYLDYDVIITDDAFNILAVTEQDLKNTGQGYEFSTAYSPDMVKDIANNPDLINFESRNNLYPVEKDNLHAVLYNFKELGVYIGAALILRVDEPISDWEMELLESIGSAIEIKFKITHVSKVDRSKLKSTLQKSIQCGFIVLSELESAMSRIGWLLEDTFRVININLHEYGSATVRNYFGKAIEDSHNNCIVFSLEKDLICLECENKKNPLETDLIDHISNLFANYDYKVGISNSGAIKNFVFYVKQCQISIELGQRTAPATTIYTFSDYIFPYLLADSKSHMPVSEICHQSLLILKKYDERNKNCLYITLRTYLEQAFHLQKTADALFIHRTTLLYRLKTIKKLTDLDLQDFRTCVHVGFSYFLMESNDSNGGAVNGQ